MRQVCGHNPDYFSMASPRLVVVCFIAIVIQSHIHFYLYMGLGLEIKTREGNRPEQSLEKRAAQVGLEPATHSLLDQQT